MPESTRPHYLKKQQFNIINATCVKYAFMWLLFFTFITKQIKQLIIPNTGANQTPHNINVTFKIVRSVVMSHTSNLYLFSVIPKNFFTICHPPRLTLNYCIILIYQRYQPVVLLLLQFRKLYKKAVFLLPQNHTF